MGILRQPILRLLTQQTTLSKSLVIAVGLPPTVLLDGYRYTQPILRLLRLLRLLIVQIGNSEHGNESKVPAWAPVDNAQGLELSCAYTIELRNDGRSQNEVVSCVRCKIGPSSGISTGIDRCENYSTAAKVLNKCNSGCGYYHFY